MIKQLKIKFVCINMLIVTLMLTVIFGMVLKSTKHNLEEQSIRMMQSLMDYSDFRDLPDAQKRVPHIVVSVRDQRIEKIYSNYYLELGESEAVIPLVEQVFERGVNRGVLQEYNLRYSRISTPNGDRIVFVDISMERSTMKDLMRTCLWIGLVSYAIFFLISVLLAQWAVKPVDQAWKQQKQFVADASHELKTPLTIIMTNSELLQQTGRSEEERMEFSKSIHTMSRQMRGLVEGLLDLARVDNGVVKTSFADVDLSSLVEDEMLPFEPVYFEGNLGLFSEIESGITVYGSEFHLRQVLNILLDNAGKYAYSGSEVRVILKKHGSCCLLSVSNHGDEISREDLKNIFKRFFRIDKARSMNHSYGLGLSIAQNIIREHRGKIWAESNNGLNSFFVQLVVQNSNGIYR